jgi:hypothetical protein
MMVMARVCKTTYVRTQRAKKRKRRKQETVGPLIPFKGVPQ